MLPRPCSHVLNMEDPGSPSSFAENCRNLSKNVLSTRLAAGSSSSPTLARPAVFAAVGSVPSLTKYSELLTEVSEPSLVFTLRLGPLKCQFGGWICTFMDL